MKQTANGSFGTLLPSQGPSGASKDLPKTYWIPPAGTTPLMSYLCNYYTLKIGSVNNKHNLLFSIIHVMILNRKFARNQLILLL
jgi:hypothetical protein